MMTDQNEDIHFCFSNFDYRAIKENYGSYRLKGHKQIFKLSTKIPDDFFPNKLLLNLTKPICV